MGCCASTSGGQEYDYSGPARWEATCWTKHVFMPAERPLTAPLLGWPVRVASQRKLRRNMRRNHRLRLNQH